MTGPETDAPRAAEPETGAMVMDAAVVGAGPAGLTAAVALAGAGLRTALIAPPHRPDNRTTALLAGSVAALDALGVWAACRDKAEPLAAIRLIDDRGGIIRAPELTFRAEEIGLDAFGQNIANADLTAALAARAAALPGLRRIEAAAVSVEPDADAVTVRLAGGASLRARLVVGADGRHSLCRQAAGIEAEAWSYRQAAVTANLHHTRSHGRVSTEFHTAAGPFTLVPLPGDNVSLVWVAEPAEAERLAALDEADFSRAVERQARSFLGEMRVTGPRAVFPLSGLNARRLAGPRIALVGEAAHVMPPIGAQGFNLGLRDAATIAELAAGACRAGRDPGASDLLARYERERRPDIGSRMLAVDMLNRSLLSGFLPLQTVRGLGLYLLDRIAPLRRAVMREGVAPGIALPRLMRGEPL